MIASNYAGQNIYVLENAPDWDGAFVCDAELVAGVDVGLTNREGRRPHGLTLRLRSRYTILLQEREGRSLAGGLMGLKTEPVVVPLWPAVVRWADRAGRAIGGGLNIVFKEDFSQWALYEGVEPGWPGANDLVAPALWGRLEGKKVEWLGPGLARFGVEHVENSPAAWAVAPTAVVFGAGPQPAAVGGYAVAPRLFPFDVNFERGVEQEFTVAILREQLGFGRQAAETLYPQAVARTVEGEYFLASGTDSGKVLRFFLEHGAGKAFWMADWVSAAVLTADMGGGDVVINVSDTDGVSVGDWLAFLGASGVMGVTARVLAKGAGTLTLDAAPGVMLAAGTLVSHALLVRFEAPKVQVQWRCNDFAEVRLRVRELAQEYNEAADETIGGTQGLLPTRCYLYEFSRVLDGVTYYERYTSFEGDQAYSTFAWLAKKITHGEMSGGLYLDRDEVEVTMDVVAGSAPVLQATLRLESPLKLRIYAGQTDGVNATNVGVVFTGEVVSARVKGSRIQAKAVTGGSLFDRKVPRFLYQRGCNHALFSVGCGLLKADWKFTATMFDVGVAGYPFSFVLHGLARVTGPAPTFFANWFAGGWIEMGAGLNWQRRAILLSSAVAAGAVTVTIDRDPDPYPVVGDGVILYPGCDLTASSCKAYDAARNALGKFDNYLNFGGHPYMPIANPSLTASSAKSGGGKK